MRILTNAFLILLLTTTALAQDKKELGSVPLIRSDKAVVFYAGEELGYYILIIDDDETSLIIRCKTLSGTTVVDNKPDTPNIPDKPTASKYGLKEKVNVWYSNVSGENKKEEAVKLGVVFFAMSANIAKGDFGNDPSLTDIRTAVGKMNRDVVTDEARRAAWLRSFFADGFGKEIDKLVANGTIKTKEQFAEAFQEVYLGLMGVK
jgi:hypothetical protein